MQISIVIPNYNGLELLKHNLDFVIKAAPGAEIIVVDDGSTDGSADFLKHKFPHIKLIEKPFNDGFSTSVNLGVKTITNPYFLLLNTDIIPKQNFLDYILPHFQDEQVFAVGCMDESIENSTLIKRGRGIGKFLKGFLIHSRGEIDKSNSLWASGGSSVFRKSLWEKLGGMDDLYDPFYWEDIDLSYRALKGGYKVEFEPLSHVVHHHEVGIIKQKYSYKQIMKIAYRNQFIFIWKNINSYSYLGKHLLWLPYHLLHSMIKGDSSFLQGFVSALFLLPQILKKRFLVNLETTKTDEEILSLYTS